MIKYTVEIVDGIAKETLILNDKEYRRETKKTTYGSRCEDDDFSEMLEKEGLLPSCVIDQVYDALDDFLVGDLLDIDIMISGE